tara:strand:+ start:4820 stop:5671 length:852 start_codon:yes stop_codon:yes gene_type:complete
MKIIKYFFEFIFISLLLIIFKLVGYKNASNLGGFLGRLVGPLFRSKIKILKNLEDCNIKNDKEKIINQMWGNYGRILAEYVYLKKFKSGEFSKFINIEGLENLRDIKEKNKKVVFISGHFNNFELMAMQLENFGINLATVYRPLNNIFLNFIMEKIRIKSICKNQIKKGRAGSRRLLELFKNGYSIALMIDQRVSEAEKVNFFNKPAYTTTIPAQLVKKYNCEVVPIYISRKDGIYFDMEIYKPIAFEKTNSIIDISDKLNKILEEMILKNPSQWIWTHDRWK